ncbi:MAG: quinolinate synthase NadA [Bacteroidales bacterium]|nr:quinolinate synthase NadA [Bacteroidales bacterium]
MKNTNGHIKELGFINEKYKKSDIIEQIKLLRKKKNAVILAHFYQIPEIQDIADFVGDSLGLSQQAASTNADMIVFCGVHFMAETAKIISPEKKVILPDMKAGCSLADSCSASDFAKFKANYPDHIVVTYINSSAELKSLSDVICTSSNAVKIVNSIPLDKKIIFTPDKNLGAYVMQQTKRPMIFWDGSCEVHDVLKLENIIHLKIKHKDAKLIAHPECKAPILEIADFVGSTTALLNYTQTDKSKKYIVATETGILHQMKLNSPEKEFIIATNNETCSCNDCPYMKLNTIEKLYICMKYEKPEIVLDLKLIKEAKKPIMKMLQISAT